MTQILKLSLLVGLLVLTYSPQLSAQTAEAAPVASESDEKARQLYVRGDRLYAEGRYKESIDAFQEAYDLSGRSGLLFNLANAFEREGRYDEALASLRKFAPDAPDHQKTLINRRIENLEARVLKEDEERRAKEAAAAAAAKQGSTTSTAAGTNLNVNAESPGMSSASKAGLVMVVLGGATILAGIIPAVLASSSRSDIDALCDGTSMICPASAMEAIDAETRRAAIADVLFAVGGVVLVGGVVALLVGGKSKKDDSSATAKFNVAPMRNGVTASFSTAF